ncbi:molybdenum ABC transporter ATP-binding protein [Roseovarius sp. SCSIO 43702]|uniref:molybdenum ABC transporter ATP-binding protein n=1 Tax=Roseovarius sp. SCSIO 43702 TaxID=2823043 RepID=UPI001C73C8D5|nr:molybdenum ABC transporter ATP-binding protein [Roseovarius sp. SCSIO 43702]QYX56071.1 molybdenum ABC transporter ATP-binding protein [Roseovarius sp. SCSIO 43702]
MSLSVALRHRFAGFTLETEFESGAGVTALFGPSGSGKTTVANAVAGLLRPDEGRITLGARVLLDTNRGVAVPVAKRRVGYVFQDSRLFPHMSVARNIRFGQRFAPAGENDEMAVIGMLGIGALMDRRPGALSGGEASRVALARALLSRPDILLMDEPLAALDAPRKEEILPYLERLRDHAACPILYVSHSLAEVTRLADRIIVLNEGRVVIEGPVEEVLSDPAALPFVGVREAGAILTATVAAHEADGLTRLRLDAGELLLPALGVGPGARVRVRILASDVLIARGRPEGLSSRNVLPAVVTALHRGEGPGVAVQLAMGRDRILARITARAAEELELRPGAEVHAILKATAVPRGSISSARER